jgi:hypothetical protein
MRGQYGIKFKIAAGLVTVALLAQAQVYVSSPSAGQLVLGAATPTTSTTAGVNSSGALAGMVGCNSSAVLSMSTSTTTQAIALAAGKSIYVCAFVMNGGGTTTGRFVHGTGTNCATSPSNLSPAFNLINGGVINLGSGLGQILKTSAGSALCVTNSAAVALNVLIVYTQF